MKKIEFIKMFKIEEALVKQIVLEKNDLIITIAMNANIFAMGNNIREDEMIECLTTYVFKNTLLMDIDLKKITNIYNSYLVGDNIILETNMGMVKIQAEEILIKEGKICQ